MAQKIVVHLTSDLSGVDADETVTFSLDGVAYEIDLTADEASSVRETLAPYVRGARRAPRGANTAVKGAKRVSDYDPKAVRRWAESNGVAVPARGRIPGTVVEKYKAAGN